MRVCEICTSEPIDDYKCICGMCADNRVADGIWTEEEKEKFIIQGEID